MLKKDPLGGFIGSFRHGKDEITYHVEGEGSPVLMTMGLSAARCCIASCASPRWKA